MKTRLFLTAAGMFALLMGASGAQTTPPPGSADANGPDASNTTVVYPAEVALSQEGTKGYLYRRFPGSQRLYFYDHDKATQSACNLGCDGARTPVYAPSSSKPIGNWTILRRYDGTYQWVYKGHPLYTLYHDAPADPQGDGEGGVWHLLGFMSAP